MNDRAHAVLDEITRAKAELAALNARETVLREAATDAKVARQDAETALSRLWRRLHEELDAGE